MDNRPIWVTLDVADLREFLQEGTFPERNALIRNSAMSIEIVEHEEVLA